MKRRPGLFERAVGIVAVGVIGLIAFGPAYQYIVRAEGATLGLSPETASVALGKTVTLRVALNSGGGVGVNAADGTVSFDTNYLSVMGVQKENGVFSLWTSDPTFSNNQGTVTFSSGSPTPYTKSGGALVTIVFKALKEGTTEVSFSGGSALAADGQGTNVLTGSGKATLTIGPGSAPEPEPAPAPVPVEKPSSGGDSAGAPITVDITSPTHPDQDKWYANKNPEFRWKLPPDVAGASAIISQSASSNPPRVSEGLIDNKRFEDVGDGIWYFAVRFKSSGGDWSQTTRRKAQIDTAAPETITLEVKNENPDVPPSLVIRATDKTSGIDHFEIKVDDREATVLNPAQIQNDAYDLPALLPGEHKVIAKAIDRAGNGTEISKQFSIPGRSMVEVSALGGSISEIEYLIVHGRADHDARVFVKIESGGSVVAEEFVKADEDGSWLYVHNKLLRRGDYEVSAKMITKAGAESGYSPKQKIAVTTAPFIERFGWLIILALIAIIIGLGIYIYFLRREHTRQTEHTLREIQETKFKTQAIFAALNEEVEEKLQLLDEATATQLGVPKLTPNDLLDKFRDALDISEDTLEKEVEGIEKTLG